MTRSTRAPRCACGSKPVFAFVVRRLIGLVAVLFAITVLTFLIFFATPGRRPEPRSSPAATLDPTTVAAVKHQFGLDRPLPVRYALMMKRLFISRDLVSYGNQALEVVPAILAAAPVTFSLVFGAAVLWVIGSIAIGLLMVTFKGTFVDPITHDPGADRHLDAGLLAGRGGEPDHAGPAARHLPLQLGAAARLHALHAGPVAVVPAPDLPVDHAFDPLHRLLRARAAGRPARGAERGLRAHGQGQGPLAARACS